MGVVVAPTSSRFPREQRWSGFNVCPLTGETFRGSACKTSVVTALPQNVAFVSHHSRHPWSQTGNVSVSTPTVWLFGPRTDVLVFAGSALASVALCLLAPVLGISGDTPLWAWLFLVVGIDVAHVWSTLFRVYLDSEELKRAPALYLAAPLGAFIVGVLAYQVSPRFFWSVFAYTAVWHFIRQKAGWMLLYGRRAQLPTLDVRLDAAAIYASTLGPVVWWHANLPRPYWWFVENDFISGLPREVGTLALAVHATVLVVWLIRQVQNLVTRGKSPVGRWLLLAATWTVWFGGIVWARDDYVFTVMNVVLHGVPYLALLYTYARSRWREGGYGRWGLIIKGGLPAFIAFLLALAFFEELLWDQWVWHERSSIFGSSGLHLPSAVLGLVVPLLALPQATHYVLDGFVWRTRNDPALKARIFPTTAHNLPAKELHTGERLK